MRVRSLGAVAVSTGGGNPDQDPLRLLVRVTFRSAFIQPNERRLVRTYAAPTPFDATPEPLSTMNLIREFDSA